ncbi:MAG: chemotaxis protein CheW, partial [Nitrosomonadales bacterium]|nr:chemotaxis protein CheW [Nitrosomonadales bacterium]
NPSYRDCVGTVLESDWVSQVRGTRTTQEYVVSRFEPTPLYKDKPTYIYAAAIRSEDNTSIVGGIGIVFDSQPQFSAMLQDSLPRDADGHPIKGSFTLYVDRDMKIISSTQKEFEVGSEFTIHPNLCKLAPGEGAFDIAIYDGRYYAIGACASGGYREYKGKDDAYQNQVTGLIFIPLGNAREIDALIEADMAFQHNQFRPSTSNASNKESREYATFYVEQDWFGIPASQIVQAVEPVNIRPIPDTPSILEGVLQFQGNVIPVMNLGELLNTEIKSPPESRQIIIIQSTPRSPQFGILVSALGEIPSIDQDKIKLISEIFFSKSNSPAVGITRVSSTEDENEMLTILSAESLWEKINMLKPSAEAA